MGVFSGTEGRGVKGGRRRKEGKGRKRGREGETVVRSDLLIRLTVKVTSEYIHSSFKTLLYMLNICNFCQLHFSKAEKSKYTEF